LLLRFCSLFCSFHASSMRALTLRVSFVGDWFSGISTTSDLGSDG
jgi:hypothetical protein